MLNKKVVIQEKVLTNVTRHTTEFFVVLEQIVNFIRNLRADPNLMRFSAVSVWERSGALLL